MKIFNQLQPQDEKQKVLFAYDSPLLKTGNGALTVTIYLSAISVVAGFYFQFFPHDSSIITRAFAAGLLLLGVLAWAKHIDGTSTAAIKWIVNSLQNSEFWAEPKEKKRTAILLIKWLAVAIGLTILSWKLSKVSAEKAGYAFSGEAKTENVTSLTKSTQDNTNAILAQFDTLYNKTERQYNKDIAALEAPFLAKIEVYEGYIKNAKTTKTGTDLQTYINKQKRNITKKQESMASATKATRKAKGEELRNIRADKSNERKRLNTLNDTNLTKTRQSNEVIASTHNEFRDTFSGIISAIAGYSIFIALVIAGALGLMEGRAGFRPNPVLTGGDYKNAPLVEILLTPLVIAERLLLNGSRLLKDKLPDLREPEKEFAYNEYDHNIIHLSSSQKARTKPAAKPAATKPRIAASFTPSHEAPNHEPTAKLSPSTEVGPRESFIVHEKPTNHEVPNHEKPTNHEVPNHEVPNHEPLTYSYEIPADELKIVSPNLEVWQLKQKLKKYKKQVGEHTQKAIKAKAKTGEVPARTQKAIKNNQTWVVSIEARLNELINLENK